MDNPCWILLGPTERALHRIKYAENVYAAGYGSYDFFVILPDARLTGEH